MPLRKILIQVEVLTDREEDYAPETLGEVAYDMCEGDCSGMWTITETTELTPEQMKEALIAQGSDPDFLFLDVS